MAAMAWLGWRATVVGTRPASVVGPAETASEPTPEALPQRSGLHPLLTPLFLGLAAVAGVGCAYATGTAFLLPWALALALAVASVVVWWRRSTPAPRDAGSPPASAHLAALLLAVAVGVVVMFVLNPSRDDVYYLNRAAWVAEHGTFPSGDTMFGPQNHPATYGAGLPIAALEEAYGTLARLFGVRAAGLAYLVANPVLAVLSVWSTWRLLRAWAPGRALLGLVVAVAVPWFTATGLLGEFAYAREWQGKVVVILLVMPLVWVHLTRLARGAPPAWSVAVLAVLGMAWSGLTVTAPIFACLLAGVGLLAALLLQGSRLRLAVGALSLAAGPVLVGIATVLSSNGPVAEANYPSDPAVVWSRMFGEDRVIVALLGFALLVGPALARSREARVLAGLGSTVSLAVLVPGLFSLMDTATGTGPIAIRMLFTAPLPVLAALLVTVPVPAAWHERLRGAAPAAYLPAAVATLLVLGLLAATGTPLWSPRARATLVDEPTWKVRQSDRDDVAAVLAARPGPGPVLLPPGPGRTLAITTTELFSAVPRDYYIQFVKEPRAEHVARYALRRFIDPGSKKPSRPVLASALETLDVSLVCVPPYSHRRRADLAAIGLTGERRLGHMVCFDGPGGGALTPQAARAPAR
jgi:hypothetical protein